MGLPSHPTAIEGDSIFWRWTYSDTISESGNNIKRAWENAGGSTRVSISTVKQILYWHKMKAAQQGRRGETPGWKCPWGQRSFFLKKCPVWSDGIKIELFGRNDHWCLEEKMQRLLAKEHHPSHEAWGWQYMLSRCFAAGGTGAFLTNWWRHEQGPLCRYIDWTSQDIDQEVKARAQMGLANGKWPQACFQSGDKMAQHGQGTGVAITKPWPQSHWKCVGRTEITCTCKEAYKTDTVTLVLSAGVGSKLHQNYTFLWKAAQNIQPKLNNLKAILANTRTSVYKLLWLK